MRDFQLFLKDEWCGMMPVDGTNISECGTHVTLKTNPHLISFPLTLPKTHSSPLKIGRPKRKRSYSKHPFSGAKICENVSFREGTPFSFERFGCGIHS